MKNLPDLEPKLLWQHFNAICSIPHPSKHEQQLANYVVSIGQKHDLKTIVDKSGNILIRKNGTSGKENTPGIILQSHLDMVPQKNEQSGHNFLIDPIQPIIDGEWLRANGTTLGADNGIGVAMMLAILESNNIKHGPLEALFTIDEETGMSGVKHLEVGFLQGKRLINLDTEEEGELCVGCAGGIDAIATMKLPEVPTIKNSNSFEVSIKGLLGGHSGVDIHLGRANAIKLLTRVLFIASENFDISFTCIRGGNIRNAIPREAFATVVIPHDLSMAFEKWISTMKAVLVNEYGGVEPNLSLAITPTSRPEKVLSEPAQNNLLRALYACPNGVYKMSSEFQGTVETSNNIAIITYESGIIKIESLIRSSIESSREDCGNALLCALSLGGAHVEFHGGYPGWKPDPSSKLLGCMQNVYKDIFSADVKVRVVHAGLECGLIGAAYPGMDMVSCGPTICFPHSPDEKVHIGSVEKFWNYLTALLERC